MDAELTNKMEGIRLVIEQFNLEVGEVELRQNESRNAFQLERDRMVELWELINAKTWVEPDQNN